MHSLKRTDALSTNAPRRAGAFKMRFNTCACPFLNARFFFFRSEKKLTRSGFKWGFGEGLLKDKFAFFEVYRNPIPKRRRLPAKRPFLKAKRALSKNPFKLDRVSLSTPDFCASKIFREVPSRVGGQRGVGMRRFFPSYYYRDLPVLRCATYQKGSTVLGDNFLLHVGPCLLPTPSQSYRLSEFIAEIPFFSKSLHL